MNTQTPEVPPAMPERADDMRLTAALDLSRNEVCAALVNQRARIVARSVAPLPAKGGRAVVERVIKSLIEIAAAPERGALELDAVGICVPGHMDRESGRVFAAVLGWDRLALVEQIERGLVDSGVDIRRGATARRARADNKSAVYPVFHILSESVAGALAETWLGAAENKQNVVFVHLGQRLGAGIIADGQVLQGAGGLAGSMAWFAMREEFLAEYANRGCLETEIAAQSLVRRTIETWSGTINTPFGQLVSETPGQLTPDAVIRAARAGDALATQVIGDVCSLLGRGLANLISSFNPETLVVGGELGVLLRPWLGEIRREARRWAHPRAGRQCRILSGTLGRDTVLLGAARYASLRCA
ncbi:MAG: ROK family protein [Blastocatellia bacterium]